MKKAASVFLRADICRQDLELLAQWLGNPQVTRYLNEHKSAVYELSRLADTVPEPMLGYHLNRHGHFFYDLHPKTSADRICKAGADGHGPGV